MDSWVWLVIALLTAAVGVAVLAVDYWRNTSPDGERRRWAASRGWRYDPSDDSLVGRWAHGAFARSRPGRATHAATGRLSSPARVRQAHLFDRERRGEVEHTVLAVECAHVGAELVLELWLPSEAFPSGSALEMLGPVGGRYAFTTDLDATRPLIVPALITETDDVGDDVSVVWLEGGWVLAAAPPTASEQRLERLLRGLGAIADELESPRAEEPTDEVYDTDEAAEVYDTDEAAAEPGTGQLSDR